MLTSACRGTPVPVIPTPKINSKFNPYFLNRTKRHKLLSTREVEQKVKIGSVIFDTKCTQHHRQSCINVCVHNTQFKNKMTTLQSSKTCVVHQVYLLPYHRYSLQFLVPIISVRFRCKAYWLSIYQIKGGT